MNPWGPINRFKQSEDYYLFDFLSREARDSIVYELLNALDKDNGKHYYTRLLTALAEHPLGKVLSESWRITVAQAMIKHIEVDKEDHP